ncbi:MAG: hypothetical protein HFE90_01775 [Firmicutes bacterium]|nr:hypothetical protein [Bacillota bacterium]
MQRSLRSDSLKVEKLNTKLNFKSARVTQDFRVIFTQSGNTVLLVYIDHHDNAYLWASKKLHGFDTASAKPVYEYFEQSKTQDFNTLTSQDIVLNHDKKSIDISNDSKLNTQTGITADTYNKHELSRTPAPNFNRHSEKKSSLELFLKIIYFLLGVTVGITISIGYFITKFI